MMDSKFPNLFSPIKIGSLTSKNRIEAAPMGVSDLTPEGYLTNENIEFYALKAKGGAGIVTIGESLVDSVYGKAHGRMIPLDTEEILPYLISCTDRIKQYGALASIELIHAGRRANPKYTGGIVYGPSAGECIYGGQVTEMTENDIIDVAEKFGDAAEMAKLGGADMCMLHGGHGWLLGQFLSPANNQRKDKFGGSIENRARFSLMAIDSIRRKCGPDFPIEFRISGDEFMENGMTLDDAVNLAALLDGKVEIIHISATSFHNPDAGQRMFPNMYLERGCNVYLAGEIKKAVRHSLVTTVGALNDPHEMESIISSGTADLVAIARGLNADPYLPLKALTNHEDDITPCLRCNNCLSANFVPYIKYPLRIIRCTVNPVCGHEFQHEYCAAAKSGKRVLIIGGGPGGMEAAITASERGHEVFLCERSDSLGGMLKSASRLSFKSDVKKYMETMIRRVQRSNVNLLLNTEGNSELIEKISPDVLIVSIGASPIVPPITGIHNENVKYVTSLKDDTEIGENVVIVGGGLAGCEEGIHLAREGKNVTIIETKSRAASDCTFLHWRATMLEIEKNTNLHLKLNSTCVEIENDKVTIQDSSGEKDFLTADTIIIATGCKPLSNEADSLRRLVPISFVIGDCNKTGKILEAVHGGHFAAMSI